MGSSVLDRFRGGLIVSCQAFVGEPLFGAEFMTRMALAAKQGGAVGIRANGGEDIRAIKRTTGLPVIGIVKRHYAQSDVYITPTMKEVDEIVEAGAEMAALDCTNRQRPDGLTLEQFLPMIKRRHPHLLLMADVSTVEEGVAAARYGADVVATTLSGYTSYSPKREGPDFALIEALSREVAVPVFAEGSVRSPEEAARCLQKGAWAVVVGTAITRPQDITRAFCEKMKEVEP